jgi:hypothetical protein
MQSEYSYQNFSDNKEVSFQGNEAYRVFRNDKSVGWIRFITGGQVKIVWAIENDQKGTIAFDGKKSLEDAKTAFVKFNEDN